MYDDPTPPVSVTFSNHSDYEAMSALNGILLSSPSKVRNQEFGFQAQLPVSRPS